ncbi:Ser-Thr-rich GPI-anchored membrane family protein, partial [uncultured Lacinutrix sp.]|uniref:Ser-Thr-rich GPI-anchored membrane family protein n=1 Tax=uncultured Lacinutrix sp. TaxID=574032 RepID=UPI002622DD81
MKKTLLLITFTILLFNYAKAQNVTITNPNGGEIFYSCEEQLISWNASGLSSDLWNLDYSLDGGIIWTSIASNYLSANDTFLWTIPFIESETVLVRVINAVDTNVLDTSDAFFSIRIPVEITSPNGGETLVGNTTHTITWNASGTSNNYTIQYRLAESGSWITIVNNYSTTVGTYNWDVPQLSLRENCRIRIYDSQEFCKQDVSDNVFTMIPTPPVLTYPNGGEILDSGCAYTIQWDSSTLYTSVRLDYSSDNGITWNTIVNGTSNDGSYSWSTPNSLPTSNYLIRISNIGDISLLDTSDSTFIVKPMVELTDDFSSISTNGCDALPINFRASTCESRFNFYYSTDDGATWNAIATNRSISGTSASIRTYNWNIPNTIDSNTVRVKVSAYYHTENESISANAFTISPSNHITVTSPNGGETLVGNTSHTITWNASGNTSNSYTIQYRTSETGSWSTIVSNYTTVGGTYNWNVPQLSLRENCRIRVFDAQQSCKEDISDAVFTITPAAPVLTYPNGGETLDSGCAYNIQWDSSTLYTSVRLDYSSDNGITWNTIVNGTSNDGSYSWSTPNSLPTSNYLIRISNIGNTTLLDT